jgi:hypothetical protein
VFLDLEFWNFIFLTSSKFAVWYKICKLKNKINQ